jgi:oxygen-independent coproporphyrinogen-3 oxidase
MKSAGVNRASIGVQSFDDANLKFLGRKHSSKEAELALKAVSELFDNFSFDLIYALPKQDITGLKKELKKALSFARDHLSMYQLTIEKGTEFFTEYNKGKLILPKDDLAVEMYDLVGDKFARKGFKNYEISNYAQRGRESKHNLTYWKYNDYIGIGPGAHGRISNNFTKEGTTNIYHPGRWLSAMQQKGIGLQKKEPIEGNDYLEEFVLMGMRLQEGISRKDFLSKIGGEIEEMLNVGKLLRNNLVKIDKKAIRATPDGRLVLNQLISELLAE